MGKQMSDVNCSRGAPMGRFSNPRPPVENVKMYLRHVHLDSGGYDDGGAYWGIGQPLFQAHAGADYPSLSYFTRADSRKAAVEEFKRQFPTMVFRKYKYLEE